MLPLYAITLGLSALLLFWVQPLYARLMLPLLGGAPAVWITAMLFFQAALLAGYLYAHLSIRWLGLGRQPLLHGALLLVAFVALPVALPAGWIPPAAAMPVGWQLALMAWGIGLPFFAVSATAPLLQRWFAHTGHAHAADPYFLYGASNIGSIAALVAYPLAIEPTLRLGTQGVVWTAGYGSLLLLIGACGWAMRRHFVSEPPGGVEEGLTLSPEIDWRRRLWWIALAFAPSSLMLGVTLHISTDIAAVPLLWVVPLILYLLTFVIVFARKPLLPHRWMLVLQVPALILLAATMARSPGGLWVELLIHLGVFFVIATACHGELAARRPAARHLTEFYLWMAVGGVLGGVFNAALAPLLFNAVLEYPLMIVAVALLRPWRPAHWKPWPLGLDFLLPILLLILVVRGFAWTRDEGSIAVAFLPFGLAVVATVFFAWRGSPVRFALGLGVLMIAGLMALAGGGGMSTGGASAGARSGGEEDKGGQGASGPIELVLAERSFFGVVRITRQDQPFPANRMVHGSIVHGAQRMDEEGMKTPQAYYHPDGPLGQAFRSFGAPRFRRVGVIGLGTGAAACYAEDGADWTFFEIDPVVERIARDPQYFTYLADCAPGTRVVIGDARLSLRDVPGGSMDMLILDAFSSDSIPVHLLTREAFLLYRSKLSESGVLMAHISNRYLDLEPVVGRIAAETGFTALIQNFDASGGRESLVYPSVWVAMALREDLLGGIVQDARWQPLRGAESALWTDDYVNIIGVFRQPRTSR